jgi:hypothetical protein
MMPRVKNRLSRDQGPVGVGVDPEANISDNDIWRFIETPSKK